MFRAIVAGSVLLFAAQLHAGGPAGDHLMLEGGADYAADFDGYAQIREWGRPGERLGLHDDLDVVQWFNFRFQAGWRFDNRHFLWAQFQWHEFRGTTIFDHDVWNDGTLYGAGTRVSFDDTMWWRAGVYYEYNFAAEETLQVGLVEGIQLDGIDIRLKPDKEPAGTKKEIHENFYAQLMPMPILGLHMAWQPLPWLNVDLFGRGIWVQSLPTWYFEGGRITHAQTTVDIGASLAVHVAQVEFGALLGFHSMMLDQQSVEDHNVFSIHGVKLGLLIRVRL